MWCKHCQQDVPGLPKATLGCVRCGTPLDAQGTPVASEQMTADPGQSATDPAQEGIDAGRPQCETPPYDDWELDEQLRHIERVLTRAESLSGQSRGGAPRLARVDQPHGTCSKRHLRPPELRSRSRRAIDSSAGAAATWVALLLGTMAFFCGGILLAWSMFAGRDELWTVGLPIALGGQIALLTGLVMQIDRIFHDNRDTSAKLDRVDARLDQLTDRTPLNTVGHSPGDVVFSHFADDAAPELLQDLKNQLDSLAARIRMKDEG